MIPISTHSPLVVGEGRMDRRMVTTSPVPVHTKWEHPALSRVGLGGKYAHAGRTTFLWAMGFGGTAVVVMLMWSGDSPLYVISAGIAGVLALLALWRYAKAPAPLRDLSERQRRLLGLPPPRNKPLEPPLVIPPEGFQPVAKPSSPGLCAHALLRTQQNSPDGLRVRTSGVSTGRGSPMSPMRQFLVTERTREMTTPLDGTSYTGTTPPPPSKYRPATSSPAARQSGSEAPSAESADELAHSLGIEQRLDEWVIRLRMWMGRGILEPLVDRLHANRTARERTLAIEQTAQAQGWQAQQQLQQQQQAVHREREMIEGYLRVPGYIPQGMEYVECRVEELAEGGCLSRFRWDSGGRWKGEDWTSDLPSDSQIVAHLFGTFMNYHLPPSGSPSGDRSVFLSRFMMAHPEKPDRAQAPVVLYQARLHPPHFKVILEGKTIWEANPGHNNVFCALVLFLYAVKTRLHGILEGVIIDGPSFNLGGILA